MLTKEVHGWHEPGFIGGISRPKLNGVGTHAGALLPDGRVAHMTPAGAEIVSLGTFAQNLPVRLEKAAASSLHSQLQQRAYLSAGRTKPYDLLTRNCEHYVSWLLGEEPSSPQVGGALIACIVGLIAVAG